LPAARRGGPRVSASISFANDSLQQLVKAAFHHNVHLILFDTLKKSPTWSRWPLRLREKLITMMAGS
jgi:hypothetical protein